MQEMLERRTDTFNSNDMMECSKHMFSPERCDQGGGFQPRDDLLKQQFHTLSCWRWWWRRWRWGGGGGGFV